MKKLTLILLVIIALLGASTRPSWAWSGHGGHGGGWHGGGWHGGGWYGGVFVGAPWWGPYPYGYPYLYGYPYSYPYGYYPPAYAYPPEGPSTYVLQQPAPPATLPQGYWYYCPSAKGYYPTVPKCPEAWVKVAPRPE